MRSVRGMIGMPLVCDGRRCGRVLRAQLAGDLSRLDGLWVGAGLGGTRFIPAERVQMIGDVAVMADCAGMRRKMERSPLPMRAVSSDGCRLGAITGADIDALSFQVTALELSLGVWDDLALGRRRITLYAVNRDSGEVVIDPAEYETEGHQHEERYDEGLDHGHADRRLGGDAVRRNELADREEVEPDGEEDGQLAERPRRGRGKEAVRSVSGV